MKKILSFGLIATMSVSAANAGWFSDLFNKQEKEPATLAEACDLDKITELCPEVILGQKTMIECVTENVKTLSQECFDYVKKAVENNSPEITEFTDKVSEKSVDATQAVKEQASEKIETVKETVGKQINAAKVSIAKKLIESASAEAK